MRGLIALFLSLILATTSVSMAVARAQAPMGGSMVLCTAQGLTTVNVDADGNPLPFGTHLCPDCLGATLTVTLPDETRLPLRLARSHVTPRTLVVQAWTGAERIPSHARDPPTIFV